MSTYTSPRSFNASQTTAHPGLPSDLSPSSFDTIPVLTSILSRLQNTTSTSTSTNGVSQDSQPLARSNSQQQSQSQTQANTSSPSFNSSQNHASQGPFSTTPLTTKDIPSATDGLKHRLQRARVSVQQLPDMQRGINEQEQEILELEGRIAEQRRVLERLREMGLKVEHSNDDMVLG